MKTSSKQRLQKKKAEAVTLVLRLYITGSTPRSLHAVQNLKKYCEETLNGQYDLEIIDIYQDPSSASEAQIIAAPTLIKKLPLPLKRLVGDLSDSATLLAQLGRQTNGQRQVRVRKSRSKNKS